MDKLPVYYVFSKKNKPDDDKYESILLNTFEYLDKLPDKDTVISVEGKIGIVESIFLTDSDNGDLYFGIFFKEYKPQLKISDLNVIKHENKYEHLLQNMKVLERKEKISKI